MSEVIDQTSRRTRKHRTQNLIENLHSRVSKRAEKILNVILVHDMLLSLIVAVFIISIGLFLGASNNKIVPVNPSPIAHYQAEPHSKLNLLANWDGPDYIHISQHGYTADYTNFFPLYPILIAILDSVISSPLYSALIISWVFFVFAVYFAIKVFKELFKITSNLEALRGVLFFVLFPTGVFLFATYTESLFAAASLGAIYFSLKRKPIAAGLFALIATATHVNGVFDLVLIAMLMFEHRVPIKKIILSVCIGSLGIVSFMVYTLIKFKNPFEFLVAQENHGWLRGIIKSTPTVGWLNFIIIVLIIITILYCWWHHYYSFAVYSGLFLLIPLVGGQFGGFARYALMIFPAQTMLYSVTRRHNTFYAIVLSVSAVLWATFLFHYTGGYVGG
jgi:Gpi18-like mannosyltransferase